MLAFQTHIFTNKNFLIIKLLRNVTAFVSGEKKRKIQIDRKTKLFLMNKKQ